MILIFRRKFFPGLQVPCRERKSLRISEDNRESRQGKSPPFPFLTECYTVGVSDTLVVNEIYLSLQGESTFAGLPCIFIRLTACDLRCSYCDTAYAFTEGKKISLEEICAEVRRLAAPFSNPQHLNSTPLNCRSSNSPAANRCSKKIPCR